MKNKSKTTASDTCLKYARQLTTLSSREFCNIHNIAYNTFISWEYNKRNLGKKKVDYVVASLLMHNVVCSREWLLTGNGDPPSVTKPLSVPGRSGDPRPELKLLAEIKYFQQLNPEAITMVIKDDAMFPVFEVGDFVGGVPLTNADWSQDNGLFCIMKIDDKYMLRRVYQISPTTISLVITNINSKAVSPLTARITDQPLFRLVYHRKA